MRKVSTIFLLFFATLAFGQEVDYNTIIPPYGSSDISFADKLVRLAWQNNPANRILETEQNITDIEIDQARWSWLDNFRITGNVNEFVLNPESDILGRGAFYPLYNISGSVSLGYFVNIPLEVKKKKAEYELAGYSISQQKIQIRAEVLRRYEQYLMAREILKVENEAQEDLFASLTLIEQNFRNGTATIDEYNAVLEKYNGQRIRIITAQGNFNQTKISLEEMIGVPLEDVK